MAGMVGPQRCFCKHGPSLCRLRGIGERFDASTTTCRYKARKELRESAQTMPSPVVTGSLFLRHVCRSRPRPWPSFFSRSIKEPPARPLSCSILQVLRVAERHANFANISLVRAWSNTNRRRSGKASSTLSLKRSLLHPSPEVTLPRLELRTNAKPLCCGTAHRTNRCTERSFGKTDERPIPAQNSAPKVTNQP